jgi:hypothetical protein
VGRLAQVGKEHLLEKYEAFSHSLGDAFDKTSDFQVMRQLSPEILGVRARTVGLVSSVGEKSSDSSILNMLRT